MSGKSIPNNIVYLVLAIKFWLLLVIVTEEEEDEIGSVETEFDHNLRT